MKLTKYTLLISLLYILLAGCSNNSPQTVAEEFYKAYHSANFKKAKSLCTADTKEGIDMMSSMMKEKDIKDIKSSKVKIEAVDCKIEDDGETAQVTIKITEENREREQLVHLQKEEGQWLVVFKIK